MEPTLPSLEGRVSRGRLGSRYNFHRQQTISNPDNLGFDTYQRMVETDETVSSALEFIEMTVFSHLGAYKHPKARITKFVRDCLNSMERSLSRVVSGIVSCIWVGHSNLEIVLEERGGRVWLKDLCDIYPARLEYQLHADGPQKGYLKSLTQEPHLKPIEMDKILHVTHLGRWDNPYGLSRLKAVYQDWFIKNSVRISWPQTLDRYGGPLALGKTPSPNAIEENGRTRAENFLDALENLQTSSAFILAPQEELDFVEVKRAFGGDFEACENHYSRMIQRGLLMPSLLFDNGSVGSFAMSQTQFDVFRLASKLMVEDVDRALIRQVVRPVVWLNFGEQSDYGEFETRVLSAEELERWSKIFFSMCNARVFRPDQSEDFLWMRDKFGAPDGVEPAPQAEPDSSGKDGLPGEAPDGQDDATPGVPRAGGRTPSTKQGRPKDVDDDEDEED